jgi:hypothetical protein
MDKTKSTRSGKKAILIGSFCLLGMFFAPNRSFSGEKEAFHFSLGGKYDLSSGIKDMFTQMGYEMGYRRNGYPKTENPFEFDISAEYSVCKNFSLGLTYAHQFDNTVEGNRWYLDVLGILSGAYLTGIHGWKTFYISGSFIPPPGIWIKNTAPKIGLGVGLSSIVLKFESLFPIDGIDYADEIEVNRLVFSAFFFGEYDFLIAKHWSIGLRIDYKYVPFGVEDLYMNSFYKDYDPQGNLAVLTYRMDFPNQKINLGGFGIGITVGFHLKKTNRMDD